MQNISSFEMQKLIFILSDEQLKLLKNSLADLPKIYDERYLNRYDPSLLAEFLTIKITELNHVDKEKMIDGIKNHLISAEEMAAAGGSWIVTELIKDYMTKMSEVEIDDESILSLIELLKCRNEFFQAEKEYIDQNYQEFLKKQLLLHS